MTHLNPSWTPSPIVPTSPPDPRFPRGREVGMPVYRRDACLLDLPYPAKGPGEYVVECSRCGQAGRAKTSGRADDPTMMRLVCKDGK